MKLDEDNYEVGDVVRWTTGGSYHFQDNYGTIVKISDKKTLHVKPASGGDVEKILRSRSGYGRRYRCQRATPLEIHRLMWVAKKPKTGLIRIERGYGRSFDNVQRVEVSISNDQDSKFAERMRAASAELLAVAAWWDERDPPGVGDDEDETEDES